MTYAVPLKVTIRLVVWNKDPETGVKTIRDIKEQEVYFGDIPLMTENGTFIINGTERVIVSQLHRSPGAFFHAEDKTLYVAQIIPYRGSWVEFEFDTKNLLYVRIDRKRKFPATVFLRALGLQSTEEIVRTFYGVDRLYLRPNVFWTVNESLVGLRAGEDIEIKGSDIVIHKGKKITNSAIVALRKAGVEAVRIDDAELEGAFAAQDVVDQSTGEVLVQANEELAARQFSILQEKGIERVDIFFPERDEIGSIISQTLRKDTIQNHVQALVEIYRRLRPGDPPTEDSSRSLFENMFFNPQKYDFSRVGRLKLNTKLGLNTPLDEKILHPQDFYEVIKFLLKLRRNPAAVDDIDHLGNRRVRSVGELLENQFRIGLVRMERAIKEKMSVYQEMATAMPHDLINAKPVMAAIREFFGSSQLSQFMDQTNPLSEVTHKRRLSALGPGGLSRERAGFEVRDVHPTHYGRICPIETPEGPNIGLISSLSCYARINEFGFIESPYRKVKDGHVVDYVQIMNGGGTRFKAGEIVEVNEAEEENAQAKAKRKKPAEWEPHSFYLSAWEEDQYIVAQANVALDAEPAPDAGARQRAQGGRLHPRAARHGAVHRRVAQAARLGRGVAHPVPRARRREPRADGVEHAAPGRAAAARPRAVRRHRHGVHHRARLGRRRRRPAGPAPSTTSTASASSSASTARTATSPRRWAPTSTASPSSSGRTRTPASTRSRSSASARTWPRGRRSPTGRAPSSASSRSGGTCWSPSCRGAATTSRTRSSSPSGWSRTTTTRPSTSRSSRSSRATPSSARRRSPATSRTCRRARSRTSTTAASSGSAPTSSRATSSSARSRRRARRS